MFETKLVQNVCFMNFFLLGITVYSFNQRKPNLEWFHPAGRDITLVGKQQQKHQWFDILKLYQTFHPVHWWFFIVNKILLDYVLPENAILFLFNFRFTSMSYYHLSLFYFLLFIFVILSHLKVTILLLFHCFIKVCIFHNNSLICMHYYEIYFLAIILLFMLIFNK